VGFPNSLFAAAQKTEPLNIRNRDFRISLKTGSLELASGLSQQGRVRDDWNNWFGCDNTRPLLHYPIPEHYARRNPHAPTADPIRQVPKGPDPRRLFPASRLLERFNDPGDANHVTSACGLGIYRDLQLGAEYYGNAFTCEPVHNVVHRQVLNENWEITSRRAPD